MKFVLLVAALAHAVQSGNVGLRASLSPADVTYVDGSFHAGLAAGPVAYSAQPVYQSVAAAAPARYAAIPTVQHVPGVADVPVTRIEAQPAVIQKTVDVARPAVKTQRYEVRRPAIQKQFYDIEERVVVRPAGSALVELEEPLSRTQKGPSVIRPTGDGVAVSSTASVAVPATVSPPAPPPLPSVDINLARSSLPAPAPAPAVEVNFARASVAGPAVQYAAPAPVQSVSYSAPAPAPVQSVSYSAPAPAPVQAVSYSAPAPAPVQAVSYSAPAPAVGVNFARTSVSAPVQSVSYSAPSVELRASLPAPAPAPVHTVSYPAPIKTVSVPTGISSISSGVTGISSVSAGHTGISFSTPAPQYQQQIVQTTARPELSDDSVSIDSADFSLARSRASVTPVHAVAAPVAAPAPEAVFRSQLPPRRFTGQPAASARGSLVVNYPNAVDLVPQHRFRTSFSEGSLQSEINHENQQKLIQLLTARGGVTEVGFGRSGSASYPVEAGEVRARVISATPAPAYSAPAGERVNTRRVVVSRPIETLQEVEVAEPVTKFERVHVDQAAVVKTATQDVVRVPTSVPVYGKTLAPVAEAAYPSGWH